MKKVIVALFLVIVSLALVRCSNREEKVDVGEEKKEQEAEIVDLSQIEEKYDRELLNFSRSVLAGVLQSGSRSGLSSDNPYKYLHYGVFVTLKKDGELRGCIGCVYPSSTVEREVSDMTVAAALNDPRFKPVSPDEVRDIETEISILYNIHSIRSIDELTLKRDGIIVRYKDRMGVLLPQVAEEGEWTREKFVQVASMKAGLGPYGWRDLPVELYTFNCKVIKEEG